MSEPSRLRVAVVGGGIAGPAAALFLAQCGHDVTVFDRASELGPKGAGILIAPTGQFVLDKLGLLHKALDRGSRIQRIEGRLSSGRKIMDLRYRHLGTGLFGLGIHRGAVFSILHEAMNERNIRIRAGWSVKRIDGEFIENEEGQREGPFDLIVVADGARSKLRSTLALQTKATPYSYGALWVSVTNWGSMPDNVLRQMYRGTRRMVGILPSGRLDGVDGRQVSLFWSLRLDEVPRWRERGIEHWKREVANLIPEDCEELLAQIESEEQVTIASYYDVRTWSSIKNHCVVIGDAAHASSPQLGQGASLALFDAMTLSECLRREPNVLAALLNYRALRQHHARFYQLASKWMTPAFQSGHTYIGWPRDVFLAPLCRWSWLQREMVSTMCGLKAGAFRTIPEAEQVQMMAARFALGGFSPESRHNELVRVPDDELR